MEGDRAWVCANCELPLVRRYWVLGWRFVHEHNGSFLCHPWVSMKRAFPLPARTVRGRLRALAPYRTLVSDRAASPAAHHHKEHHECQHQ